MEVSFCLFSCSPVVPVCSFASFNIFSLSPSRSTPTSFSNSWSSSLSTLKSVTRKSVCVCVWCVCVGGRCLCIEFCYARLMCACHSLLVCNRMSYLFCMHVYVCVHVSMVAGKWLKLGGVSHDTARYSPIPCFLKFFTYCSACFFSMLTSRNFCSSSSGGCVRVVSARVVSAGCAWHSLVALRTFTGIHCVSLLSVRQGRSQVRCVRHGEGRLRKEQGIELPVSHERFQFISSYIPHHLTLRDSGWMNEWMNEAAP